MGGASMQGLVSLGGGQLGIGATSSGCYVDDNGIYPKESL